MDKGDNRRDAPDKGRFKASKMKKRARVKWDGNLRTALKAVGRRHRRLQE